MFDPTPFFKFEIIDNLQELIGQKIKEIDYHYMFQIIITEDNDVLFQKPQEDWVVEELEIYPIAKADVIRILSAGDLPHVLLENNLIDEDAYYKAYKDNLHQEAQEQNKLEKQNDYQLYLKLKKRFEG